MKATFVSNPSLADPFKKMMTTRMTRLRFFPGPGTAERAAPLHPRVRFASRLRFPRATTRSFVRPRPLALHLLSASNTTRTSTHKQRTHCPPSTTSRLHPSLLPSLRCTPSPNRRYPPSQPLPLLNPTLVLPTPRLTQPSQPTAQPPTWRRAPRVPRPTAPPRPTTTRTTRTALAIVAGTTPFPSTTYTDATRLLFPILISVSTGARLRSQSLPLPGRPSRSTCTASAPRVPPKTACSCSCRRRRSSEASTFNHSLLPRTRLCEQRSNKGSQRNTKRLP